MFKCMWVSNTTISCDVSKRTVGTYSLSLTMNRQNWISSASASVDTHDTHDTHDTLQVLSSVYLTSVSPSTIPWTGGSIVHIYGWKFNNSTNDSLVHIRSVDTSYNQIVSTTISTETGLLYENDTCISFIMPAWNRVDSSIGEHLLISLESQGSVSNTIPLVIHRLYTITSMSTTYGIHSGGTQVKIELDDILPIELTHTIVLTVSNTHTANAHTANAHTKDTSYKSIEIIPTVSGKSLLYTTPPFSVFIPLTTLQANVTINSAKVLNRVQVC